MIVQNNCAIYANGSYRPLPTDLTTSTTVSGGNAVFYLTDDGTASGKAVFSEVFLSSMHVSVPDSTALFQPGAGTLSPDKKTLTVPINKFAVNTTGAVVLSINVLTSANISLTAAPNGTVANLMIEGIV